jgi:hypothetical protein
MESDGGMILTGEIGEFGEEPAAVLSCLPQIPHGLPRTRTRSSVVGCRRETA